MRVPAPGADEITVVRGRRYGGEGQLPQAEGCAVGREAERVTGFDAALVETAAAEGLRQSRSARQQLEHWARLGAALSAQMEAPANRVRLALDGVVSQRDLTLVEARQLDAAIAVRIDDVVARADFSDAPLPDFTAVLPDPQRVLVDLATRARAAAHERDRLPEALTRLGHVLDEQHPAEPGR